MSRENLIRLVESLSVVGIVAAHTAPAKNLASIQASPSPSPIQETHGVVSRETCYKMEGDFQQQGRRIRFVRVNKSTSPGAVLQYVCIFEGEDADQGYFEEKRYQEPL